MLVTLQALLPVGLLIALGFGLRRSGFMPAESWGSIERLVYFVLFLSLLFVELAATSFGGQPLAALVVTLLGTQVAMGGLASGVRLELQLPGPTYTSVLQGVVRWNSYVVLSLIPPLFGDAGLPLGAVTIAVLVPAANLMSVAALARHGTARGGLAVLTRALLTNPLLIACVLGIAWNLSGLALPTTLDELLRMLGRATLALGLLAVGAGLQSAATVKRPGLLLAVCAIKLIIMPLLAYGLGKLMGLIPAQRSSNL
jgi:predicted permease